jgi:hypothetical protein
MLQKIRIFLQYAFAWILIIGCVAVIGFVLYPLLSEKYTSMALRSPQAYTGSFTVKRWYPLEIERTKINSKEHQIQLPTGKSTKLDTIEAIATQNISGRVRNFFKTFKEAFSTNTNKKNITYTKDETGVYHSQ